MAGNESAFQSQAQLRRALASCFSPSVRGPIVVEFVAEELGVTPRTVRRWVRDGGRTRAPIGRKALRQLQFGDALDARREAQKIDVAHRSLEQVRKARRRRDIPESWRSQQWLAEHRVVVVEHRPQALRQVVFTHNHSVRARDYEIKGEIIASIVVPTRFDAVITCGAITDAMQQWRLTPAIEYMPLSRTRCWSTLAPAVELGDYASNVNDE